MGSQSSSSHNEASYPILLLRLINLLGRSEIRRSRRDLTCAAGGTRLCNLRCKGVGRADGTCVWNTETGAYNCECAEERRGIRCNLGGENTCYYSCKALGYRNGMCDAQDNCECGGGNNRWGDLIENVRDRL